MMTNTTQIWTDMTPKDIALVVEKLLIDAGYQMEGLKFSEPMGDFIARHDFTSNGSEINGHSEKIMTCSTAEEIKQMIQAGINNGNTAMRRTEFERR